MNTQRINYSKFVDFIFCVANNQPLTSYSNNFIQPNVPIQTGIGFLDGSNCVSPLVTNCGISFNHPPSVSGGNHPPSMSVETHANPPPIFTNFQNKKKFESLNDEKKDLSEYNKQKMLEKNSTLNFNEINRQLELEIKQAKSEFNKKQKNLLEEKEMIKKNKKYKNNDELLFEPLTNADNISLRPECTAKILYDLPNKQTNIYRYNYDNNKKETKESNKNIHKLIEPFEDNLFEENESKMSGKILFDFPRKSFEEQMLEFEKFEQEKNDSQKKKKVSWNLYDDEMIHKPDTKTIEKKNNDNNNLEFITDAHVQKKKIGKTKLYEIENEFDEGISNCVILYQNYVDLYKSTKFTLTMDGNDISACKNNLQSVGNFIHLKITFYSLIGKKKNKKIIYHSLTEYELWAYENKGKYFIYNLSEEKEEENLDENQEPKETIEQTIIYATNGGICIYATICFYIKEGKFMIDFQMNNSYEKFYASNFANLNIIRYIQKN
jgi:hypothetical protein